MRMGMKESMTSRRKALSAQPVSPRPSPRSSRTPLASHDMKAKPPSPAPCTHSGDHIEVTHCGEQSRNISGIVLAVAVRVTTISPAASFIPK